jgi:Lrp/AsnC family transcriptional regulator
MDEIDRRIISALQDNASISNSDLAEVVGSSPASCWRRIRALQDAGILLKSVWLVDPAKVGRGVDVLCNVRMRSHALEARTAFESFVDNRPEIVESFSMSGEWDYLLRIVVSDVGGYNLFLMHSLLAHPSVAGAASHFALSRTKYSTTIPV